jgi:hypothetical protein
MNRTLAETGACRRFGYLGELMAALNATWPHAGHLLVNAGRSGAHLGSFAEYVCIDGWLPAEVDLVLFESHDAREALSAATSAAAVHELEKLWYLLLAKLPPAAAPPPLVLLNVWPLSNTSARDAPGGTCLHSYGRNCSSCTGASVFGEHLRAVGSAGTTEDALHGAARYHGWTSLSHRNFLLAGLAAGEPARLGWSECEWLVSFSNDWIHPGLQGKRLFGDWLLSVLAAAQDEPPPLPGPVEPPISADVASPPLRMCADGSQLAVRQAAGWAYLAKETVHNQTVYKPGWVASEAGAVMEVEIGTRFHTLPKETDVSLTLAFLSSYEHMGRVEASCVRGCECDSAVFDAHSSQPEHVSVEAAGLLRVSQARRCNVRLVVLEGTSSGERKWKLLGLTVNAERG